MGRLAVIGLAGISAKGLWAAGAEISVVLLLLLVLTLTRTRTRTLARTHRPACTYPQAQANGLGFVRRGGHAWRWRLKGGTPLPPLVKGGRA